eukprot:Pgem_evm1s5282
MNKPKNDKDDMVGDDDENEGKIAVNLKETVYEIRITNQLMHLLPSLEKARENIYAQV